MEYDKNGIAITDKHVFFFKNICPFSNFYEAEYTGSYSDGVCACIIHKFKWSEQEFMLEKALFFGDDDAVEKILAAKSPAECKDLGRKVRNYDDKKWDEIRYDMMFKANFCKFSNNEELRKFILDERFEGKTFVEASPYDKIWGIAMRVSEPGVDDEKNWRGTNLLGKVLTELRALLKTMPK